MDRFTERDKFGNVDVIGVDSYDLQILLGVDNFNKVANALNKLAEYEDLEEQKKLLKLPFAVGDMVYTNHSIQGMYFRKKDRPYEARVAFIKQCG